MKINKISELESYLSKEHLEALHEKAFLDTFNLIADFMQRGVKEQLLWVCNSIMGAGKSTGLQTAVAILIREKVKENKIPLLMVFNNKDNMKKAYKSIHKFAKQYDKEIVLMNWFMLTMQRLDKNILVQSARLI